MEEPQERAPEHSTTPAACDGELSPRELLTLQLLSQAYSVGRIAAVLVVSSREVEALIAQASARLGARDRLEAVATARRRGLIL